MHASGLWSIHSINFQIRQIPATNQHFSTNNNPFYIKPYCCVGQQVEISEKKTFFSSFRSRYHRLTNRKKLILPLEKYFKTLNDMIIGTAGTKPLQSFTIFQSGQNNGVKIWVFDATRGIYRYVKLPLILMSQMK